MQIKSSFSVCGIRVKFIYEGHRVNVKVTGAQKHEIAYSAM